MERGFKPAFQELRFGRPHFKPSCKGGVVIQSHIARTNAEKMQETEPGPESATHFVRVSYTRRQGTRNRSVHHSSRRTVASHQHLEHQDRTPRQPVRPWSDPCMPDALAAPNGNSQSMHKSRSKPLLLPATPSAGAGISKKSDCSLAVLTHMNQLAKNQLQPTRSIEVSMRSVSELKTSSFQLIHACETQRMDHSFKKAQPPKKAKIFR